MSTAEARSPSGKAKVCKTFIGGSIPPRASKSTPSNSWEMFNPETISLIAFANRDESRREVM